MRYMNAHQNATPSPGARHTHIADQIRTEKTTVEDERSSVRIRISRTVQIDTKEIYDQTVGHYFQRIDKIIAAMNPRMQLDHTDSIIILRAISSAIIPKKLWALDYVLDSMETHKNGGALEIATAVITTIHSLNGNSEAQDIAKEIGRTVRVTIGKLEYPRSALRTD